MTIVLVSVRSAVRQVPESGIYSAGYLTECDHHKNGRPYTGSIQRSIQSFAAHQATMVVFLSTGMLEELSRRLIEGGYTADTPAAIVYKATWPDEKKFVCTVGTLAQTAAENNITKTALMIIGDSVKAAHYDRSKLYDPGFTTEFREATE